MNLDSLYWVITHNCNDQCDHCYNSSRPGAVELTIDEAGLVIAHFPPAGDAPLRAIISGGEPLVNRSLLNHCLDGLFERYGDRTQYMVQTNGDLLTGEILDDLILHHVTRIDVGSIDRFHKAHGSHVVRLAALLESRGFVRDDSGALVSSDRLTTPSLSYAMWGANEDFWIGGNWPRGRAVETGVALNDPQHNFCAVTSGARGFAGFDETLPDGTTRHVPREVSIQLYNLYPCCPGTRMPIADLRRDDLDASIARIIRHPMWQALNAGDPWRMGLYAGVSEESARSATGKLGSICSWCDYFFEHVYEQYIPNDSEPHRDLHATAQTGLVHIELPVAQRS